MKLVLLDFMNAVNVYYPLYYWMQYQNYIVEEEIWKLTLFKELVDT